MSSKMGRPKLPKGESKSTQIGVRFNASQDEAIDNAAEQSGQSKVDYVRDSAVSKAQEPRYWVKCKWSLADLQDKTVEFTLPTASGRSTPKAIGLFLVKDNQRGKLDIQICVTETDGRSFGECRYFIAQVGADLIELHPDQSVARFQMFA